jgi:hypothetical protein
MAAHIIQTRSRGRRPAARAAVRVCCACVAAGAWWASHREGAASRDAPPAAALASPARLANGPPAAALSRATVQADARPSVVLEKVEMSPSGALSAVLLLDGGPPRRHLQGDALDAGVRLSRIDLASVDIEFRDERQTLRLPPGVAPLQRERVRVAAAPMLVTLPMPPTPAVAQLLQSPPNAGVVTASPDRPNPPRGGVDRMVAREALRLSTP